MNDKRFLVTAEHRPEVREWFATEDAASEWIGAQLDQDAVLAGRYSLDDMQHPGGSVRMKVTVTFEYDADFDLYENKKPVDMADFDKMQFEDDPGTIMEAINNLPFNITVEPINGNP